MYFRGTLDVEGGEEWSEIMQSFAWQLVRCAAFLAFSALAEIKKTSSPTYLLDAYV